MKKKWALLSWYWLSKPLKVGGLGLRDPYILNQVMWAKLWWRWIQGGIDLWKEIWGRKYGMPRLIEGMLRVQENIKGLTIWNLASENRELIRPHIFWEIKGGDKSNFWNEAW